MNFKAKDQEVLFIHESSRRPSFFRLYLIFLTVLAVLVVFVFTLLFLDFRTLSPFSSSSSSSSPFPRPQPKSVHVESPACPIAPYDYLAFAIRWSPSVCLTTRCVDHVGEKWLIHGLWPNYWNGSYPHDCCPDEDFDVEKVKSIEKRLKLSWANLEYGKSAESFWAHEWTKHGTCSAASLNLKSELPYFNSTLALFESLPLKSWFEGDQIEPSPETLYTETIFLETIQSQIQVKAHLHCDKVSKSITEFPILDTIYICVDKSISPIDCPDNLSIRVSGSKDLCKPGFIYPPKSMSLT